MYPQETFDNYLDEECALGLIKMHERMQELEVTCRTLASQFGESFNAHLLQKLNRREEEIKQLSEALKSIANEKEVGEGYEYADQLANHLINKARQALEK